MPNGVGLGVKRTPKKEINTNLHVNKTYCSVSIKFTKVQIMSDDYSLYSCLLTHQDGVISTTILNY